MKAMELIEQLNYLVLTYGDHDVRLHGNVNIKDINFQVMLNDYFIIKNDGAPI